MTSSVLRIATRASDLAIWQAEHVGGLLADTDEDLRVEYVPVTTSADRRLDLPIAEIGGKGVFAKEVQNAVLDGRADVAVHSAKDLTAATIEGLSLAAVPERGDARDALAGCSLDRLRPGAVVGTGSARRAVQLRTLRDDIEVVGLRGNIATRLGHLDELDAIVVAAAGLQRLGLTDRIAQLFEPDEFVPQVAQGALAIECRSDDPAIARRLAGIEDSVSRLQVDAERSFLRRLGGDCDLPAGAHASSTPDGRVTLTGVLAPDAAGPLSRSEVRFEPTREAALAAGVCLAEQLLGLIGDDG